MTDGTVYHVEIQEGNGWRPLHPEGTEFFDVCGLSASPVRRTADEFLAEQLARSADRNNTFRIVQTTVSNGRVARTEEIDRYDTTARAANRVAIKTMLREVARI